MSSLLNPKENTFATVSEVTYLLDLLHENVIKIMRFGKT
jgi:hypothetical protein